MKLNLLSAATLAAQRSPPVRFLWHGMLPIGNVSLLSGAGGTGKSTLALQLAMASASGGTVAGHHVERGRALYLSGEDGGEEIGRRVRVIGKAESIDPGSLDDLQIAPMTDGASFLANGPRGGDLAFTPAWAAFAGAMREIRPVLAIIDPVAEFFGGDEIDRSHATRFVGELRRLAHETETAVVVVMHPSVAGLAEGSGRSGSVAWANGSRSVIHMTIEKPGSQLRRLRIVKNNLGPSFDRMLDWKAGRFIHSAEPDEKDAKPRKVKVPAGSSPADPQADEAFLALLDRHTEAGKRVSPASGRTFAPAVFAAAYREGRAIGKERLGAAMTRLIGSRALLIVTGGKPSKPTKTLYRPSPSIDGHRKPMDGDGPSDFVPETTTANDGHRTAMDADGRGAIEGAIDRPSPIALRARALPTGEIYSMDGDGRGQSAARTKRSRARSMAGSKAGLPPDDSTDTMDGHDQAMDAADIRAGPGAGPASRRLDIATAIDVLNETSDEMPLDDFTAELTARMIAADLWHPADAESEAARTIEKLQSRAIARVSDDLDGPTIRLPQPPGAGGEARRPAPIAAAE